MKHTKVFLLGLLSLVLFVVSACKKSEEGAEGGGNVNVSAQIANLKSSETNVKVDACVELGKAGEAAAEAVPALIELLKDSSGDVRRMASYALGQIGPKAKAALPALQQLMNDPVREVIMQTVNTLRAIDPASAPKPQM